MKKFVITKKLSIELKNNKFSWLNFIKNSQKDDEKTLKIVQEIIEDVKLRRDNAIVDLTNQFDKTNAKKIDDLIINKAEILASEELVDKKVKEALKFAKKRIETYHKKQLPKNFSFKDSSGTTLGNIWKPIEKIGVYVPGGTASYPSSVLMSVIPAQIAGVKNICLFVPSNNGKINPAVLFASKICGINSIYKIGGAQAIAGMCFGTESINAVDKIVGPGNAFVASAKKLLYGKVGIDMIAGPTDITIIADNSANPSWIAIDALSQLEHGEDSKAYIICDNENFADKIISEINIHLKNLSRKKIIEQSLKNSAIFVINNINDAHLISNLIAPEHLEICTKNSQKIMKKISNAGAIFLGNYTPEAIGDYVAGPSHTLPTSASSRFSSGLSVFDFLKRISLISCTKKSFLNLCDVTSVLAKCEGLNAHQLSIEIRKS